MATPDTMISPPTPLPDTGTPRKVFIETLGCQMNKNDSELMLGLLAGEGFMPVSNPEGADLVIINTCQIRENAEDKAYSHLGRWGVLKRNNPHIKVAMAGCVAQQTKESIFKRAPYVDLVFGTQNIQDLPALVRQVFDEGRTHVLATDRQKPKSTYDYFSDVTPVRESTLSAWVTIIEGCDYFCTYCVVPYTRGRQISRPPESVIREVEQLAREGYKEITLLGQTVDAYGKDFTDRAYDLADLLEALNAIEGLLRIRFMTSHPLDLSDRIIESIARLPKVMEYIHLPMQAGDTEVLTRMRRGYTAEEYYALLDKIYARVPDVEVSGDYIVGFPGETDAQFQNSVASVKRSGVYGANVAAYSARKQTPAALWEARGEEVPDAVKQERLQILNEEIKIQSLARNRRYQNQLMEVLVEGPSKRNPERLTGRTRNNKVVNFTPCQPPESLVGQLVQVRITEPFPFSMVGVQED